MTTRKAKIIANRELRTTYKPVYNLVNGVQTTSAYLLLSNCEN